MHHFSNTFLCRYIRESSLVKHTLHPTNNSSRDQEDEVITEPGHSKRARTSTSFDPNY